MIKKCLVSYSSDSEESILVTKIDPSPSISTLAIKQ